MSGFYLFGMGSFVLHFSVWCYIPNIDWLSH